MLQIGEMAREVGVEGEEDLVAVLEFYNSLGLLAYWGEAAVLSIHP